MILRAVTIGVFAVLVFSSIARAQTASPAATPLPSPQPSASATADPGYDRIDAMWRTGAEEAWFSASFLKAIPFTAIAPVLGQVKAALGTYASTQRAGGSYVSTFSNGTQEVRIHFDADGKIDGLFLPPPKPAAS